MSDQKTVIEIAARAVLHRAGMVNAGLITQSWADEIETETSVPPQGDHHDRNN